LVLKFVRTILPQHIHISQQHVSELTSSERRGLRARAHHLEPVVIIGNAGVTPEVVREVDANLKSHELIKIRALGDDRAARANLLAVICEATGAQPVQQIGKILVVYRPRPPEDQKRAQPRPRRQPARKTKRSFQRT
jgi:putative YhbY family RNA-binding protein